MSVTQDIPLCHGVLNVIVPHDLLFREDLHGIEVLEVLLDQVDFTEGSLSEDTDGHELVRVDFGLALDLDGLS